MTQPIECTLLELLEMLNDLTDDDHEVAAVVASLVNTGRVHLTGNFAGAQIELPESFAVFPESVWPALLSLRSTAASLQQTDFPQPLAA